MFNVNGYIRVDLHKEDIDRLEDAANTLQELSDSILDYTGNSNGWTDALDSAHSVLEDILNGGVY